MVGDNFLEIIDSDDELLLAEENSSDTVQIGNIYIYIFINIYNWIPNYFIYYFFISN